MVIVMVIFMIKFVIRVMVRIRISIRKIPEKRKSTNEGKKKRLVTWYLWDGEWTWVGCNGSLIL